MSSFIAFDFFSFLFCIVRCKAEQSQAADQYCDNSKETYHTSELNIIKILPVIKLIQEEIIKRIARHKDYSPGLLKTINKIPEIMFLNNGIVEAKKIMKMIMKMNKRKLLNIMFGLIMDYHYIVYVKWDVKIGY